MDRVSRAWKSLEHRKEATTRLCGSRYRREMSAAPSRRRAPLGCGTWYRRGGGGLRRWRAEMGDGRWEMGTGRWEMGEGSWRAEGGSRKSEVGGRRPGGRSVAARGEEADRAGDTGRSSGPGDGDLPTGNR